MLSPRFKFTAVLLAAMLFIGCAGSRPAIQTEEVDIGQLLSVPLADDSTGSQPVVSPVDSSAEVPVEEDSFSGEADFAPVATDTLPEAKVDMYDSTFAKQLLSLPPQARESIESAFHLLNEIKQMANPDLTITRQWLCDVGEGISMRQIDEIAAWARSISVSGGYFEVFGLIGFPSVANDRHYGETLRMEPVKKAMERAGLEVEGRTRFISGRVYGVEVVFHPPDYDKTARKLAEAALGVDSLLIQFALRHSADVDSKDGGDGVHSAAELAETIAHVDSAVGIAQNAARRAEQAVSRILDTSDKFVANYYLLFIEGGEFYHGALIGRRFISRTIWAEASIGGNPHPYESKGVQGVVAGRLGLGKGRLTFGALLDKDAPLSPFNFAVGFFGGGAELPIKKWLTISGDLLATARRANVKTNDLKLGGFFTATITF